MRDHDTHMQLVAQVERRERDRRAFRSCPRGSCDQGRRCDCSVGAKACPAPAACEQPEAEPEAGRDWIWLGFRVAAGACLVIFVVSVFFLNGFLLSVRGL